MGQKGQHLQSITTSAYECTLTPLSVVNLQIASAEPDSCFPNLFDTAPGESAFGKADRQHSPDTHWLHGHAMTSRPLSLYLSCSATSSL